MTTDPEVGRPALRNPQADFAPPERRRPALPPATRRRRGRLSTVPFPALLFALAATASAPGQSAQAPPPDPVAMNAWTKILGLMSGGLGAPAPGAAAEPVVLSQVEVAALLAAPPIAPLLREQGGISAVGVRFVPGEVHLSAAADPDSLAEVLPFPGRSLGGASAAGAAPGAPVHLEMTLRLRGAAGYGEATLVAASADGAALPPPLVEEAVVSWLLAAFALEGSASRFPLPAAVRALEVEAGQIRLTPAAPPGG